MRFRDWLRTRPFFQSEGEGVVETTAAAVQSPPSPVLYNGRYTGSSVPERVKAPLPPGASVIDDTIADWLKAQGMA